MHTRLVRFFSANDPKRLSQVDALFANAKGDVDSLLQQLHREYGVRDVDSTVAEDEVYENERFSFLTMKFGSSFPGHLMVLDRKRYSASHGTPSSQVFEHVEPELPPCDDDEMEWVWTSPWEIDATYVPCDREGWTYAFDFSNFSSMLLKHQGHARPGMTDYVRRRRWRRSRMKKKKQTQESAISPSTPSPTIDVIEPTPIPAPTEDSTMQFYKWNMSAMDQQTEWSAQVKKLQQLHTKLEHVMAGRRMMWKRVKLDLKNQAKAAKATIASLQAQVLDEEKRGIKSQASQSKLSAYSSHYEDLKRRIWFPKEKGYLLRASLIGLYIGVKDLWMDTAKLRFTLVIQPQPTSDRSVRCHLQFSGNVVVRLHGVKLKAEKGTRVPNSRWTRVYLTTECIGDIMLLYKPQENQWMYRSDLGKGIEFHKMHLKVKGGMDLPDGVFKMLLTEVANTLVQDTILSYFPPELGQLFVNRQSKLELQGELHVDGPSIKDIIDATLEPVKEVNGVESSKMPLERVDEICSLLGLTRGQLNLLSALRGFILCPAPHSLQSIEAIATYFRTYYLSPMDIDDVEPILKEWCSTWQHLIELLYLQRKNDPRGISLELFNFEDCILKTRREVMEKHVPCRLQLNHLVCQVELCDILKSIAAVFTRYMTAAKLANKKTNQETTIYGIRIGRKSFSNAVEASGLTQTMTKEVEMQIADMNALCHRLQTFLATSAVHSIECDMDGRMIGTERNNARDAEIKVHLPDLNVAGKGPIDFTHRHNVLYSLGQVAIETSKVAGGMDVKLKSHNGDAFFHVNLLDIETTCDLDLKMLPPSLDMLRIASTKWGQNDVQMVFHEALQGHLHVGSTDVNTHLASLLRAFFALVQSQLRSVGLWPDKVIEYVLKYCSSDEFLVAWSLHLDVVPQGQVRITAIKDHPQPFLYFDHLQIVPLLLDMEDMIRFWIATNMDSNELVK